MVLSGVQNYKGAKPLYNPQKDSQSTLKEKQKMQKTTEGEKTSLSGFPIEDLGNDVGGGFPPAFRE